jgi:hypothetical protein
MHRTRLRSTDRIAAGYDGERHLLEVEFEDGRIYQYEGVPMEVYHDLLESAAPGKYLDARVKKGGYRYRRIH